LGLVDAPRSVGTAWMFVTPLSRSDTLFKLKNKNHNHVLSYAFECHTKNCIMLKLPQKKIRHNEKGPQVSDYLQMILKDMT
jgi:hypothetical protein